MFLLIEIIFLFFGVWLVVSMTYPAEVVQKLLMTTIPWFLGGASVYFMGAFIILEPSWVYRIIYGVVAYGLIELNYRASTYDQYQRLWVLILLVAVMPLTIMFAGHRFRRGSK